MGSLCSVLAAAVALMMSATATETVPIKVLDQIVGQDSFRVQAGAELARNSDDWAKVWSAHRGADGGGAIIVVPDSAPPAVDFSKAMVLAIFDGERVQATEFRIAAAKDFGDHAVIRITAIALDRPALRLQTRSFGMFMITRYAKPVSVEIERDGKWVVVAKFGAAPVRSN
jgi:hypothetical protein